MAPAIPPDYGSIQYWDQKYTDNKQVFDWLLPPDDLDHEISHLLKKRTLSSGLAPRILHIGSGTSNLSFALLKHVNHPSQIYNIDYSQTAIEWGKSKEKDGLQSRNKQDGQKMNWIQASLLHLPDVRNLRSFGPFSLIVDKCTADCIACGDDIMTKNPFPYLASSQNSKSTEASASYHMDRSSPDLLPTHPLHVLCVHLALLTDPAAVWLVISYSASRFDFLDSAKSDYYEYTSGEFPHPSMFWTIERKEVIGLKSEETKIEADRHVVHRPRPEHHLFVLKRTEVRLAATGAFC